MGNKIQFKRGISTQIPQLAYGEPGFVSDEGELYIGTENENLKLTSKSEIKKINKQLDSISYFITPEMFGYKYGENKMVELETAIEYAKKNNCKLICKKIKLFKDIDFRRVHLEITDYIELESYNITLGSYSTSPTAPPQNINTIIQTTNSIQIFIKGCKGQKISIVNCGEVIFQLSEDSKETSQAYNEFNFTKISGITIQGESTSTQLWFNENTFNIKRTGKFVIKGTYPHNNNIINGGCFEGSSALIRIENGDCNIFKDIRFEGTPSVYFGKNTRSNYIFTSWVSSSLRPSVTINNLGFNNKVVFEQLSNEFQRYMIDTENNSDTHFKALLNNGFFTCPNYQDGFVSGFIPYKRGLTFKYNLIGHNNLGYRFKYECYDENFTKLDNVTDKLFTIQGVGSILPNTAAPSVNNKTSLWCECDGLLTDSRIKYLKLLLISGSTAIKYKGMEVIIRSGEDHLYM